MDPTIEEFTRRVLEWRHRQIPSADLYRYATHLREVVQPQLDLLAKIKARRASHPDDSAQASDWGAVAGALFDEHDGKN